MTTCPNCGATTDIDLDSCQTCGRALLIYNPTAHPEVLPPGDTAPQIELISRGWSVVDVDATELPPDLSDGVDVSSPPLPPDSIEIAVDDISVIARGEEDDAPQAMEQPEPASVASDPWEHLRPKGEMPRLARRVSVRARVVETLAALTAVLAVTTGAALFFLNTRLQAVNEGSISADSISGIERAGNVGLIAVAAAAILTTLGWLIWRHNVYVTTSMRLGRTGNIALLAGLGVAIVIGSYYLLGDESVTQEIASNTIIILGLGLVATASILTMRLVEGVEHRMHI
jgi:hypothetical protein